MPAFQDIAAKNGDQCQHNSNHAEHVHDQPPAARTSEGPISGKENTWSLRPAAGFHQVHTGATVSDGQHDMTVFMFTSRYHRVAEDYADGLA
jgi:hypothetical protein